MGHKRTRNRIPALPEAVKNLLALHSLEAWPAKHEEFPRGARSWAWRVIKVGEDHITGLTLFTVKGSHDLDYWLKTVDDYNKGHLFFGVDFESQATRTGRWNGLQMSSIWLDELKDIEARLGAVAKFP